MREGERPREPAAQGLAHDAATSQLSQYEGWNAYLASFPSIWYKTGMVG
jgi:hypothetical protein